eukprot:Phypoly_transcript_04675.p1 GENE.Phypoly_transcript_04675~~Phypoly_transcript_04675.p1  ORF type:complete len:451 (-),score=59.07 Phypoly_transcript_04675:82-1434(-)
MWRGVVGKTHFISFLKTQKWNNNLICKRTFVTHPKSNNITNRNNNNNNKVNTKNEKEENSVSEREEKDEDTQGGIGPEPHYQKVSSGYELFEYKSKISLEHGGTLPSFQIAYETWGTMDKYKENVVLLHTGLSASSHAKSHDKNMRPGWWEEFIGPGKPVDTNRFFVICTNVIGGCYGSTGPSSIDPKTGNPYATHFPFVTVGDMVKAQFRLLDHLGVERLYASVGSSLGGMQSLLAAALFPDRVGRVVSISAAARSHPMSIAMRYAQRQVLMSDPNWQKGFYYNTGKYPHTGMKLAREIGTITYRSGPEWEERFSRKHINESQSPPTFGPQFQIEGYLNHQGSKFSKEYDPNSLLYISKAMDMFDMGLGQKSFEAGVGRIKCPALILGVQSDILFPVFQQLEVAEILQSYGTPTTYYELRAKYGHDTFLIDLQTVGAAVKGHLEASTFL